MMTHVRHTGSVLFRAYSDGLSTLSNSAFQIAYLARMVSEKAFRGIHKSSKASRPSNQGVLEQCYSLRNCISSQKTLPRWNYSAVRSVIKPGSDLCMTIGHSTFSQRGLCRSVGKTHPRPWPGNPRPDRRITNHLVSPLVDHLVLLSLLCLRSVHFKH